MEPFEVRTNVPQSELQAARKKILPGRRRDFMAQTVTTGWETPDAVDGDTGYVSAPPRPGRRRPGLEVRNAIVDRRMTSAEKLASGHPQLWKDMIEKLRAAHPDLVSSMTDMEIYAKVVERSSADATQRVFTRLGRNTATIR